jgi:hypothetical protein
VASCWLVTRTTKHGERRYRVEYRLGGREAPTRYAGSFRTKLEANLRKSWITGELAALRVPDLTRLTPDRPNAPALVAAADTWRASRVDVVEQTRNMHRSAVGRIFRVAPKMRGRRVDELTVDEVAELIAALVAAGYKRETIKKSRDALAMLLDFYAVDPNPARDKRVKLPKERKAHVPPPLAEQVERVVEALPRQYVLPLLVIDECGPRVRELETAQVGDLDEHRRAIRVRWTVEKNDRYRHLELPDDLFGGARCHAAAARGPRAGSAAVLRVDGRAPTHGDHPRLQGDRDAAFLAALSTSAAGIAAVQALRLTGRSGRTARRLEAGRRRPLRLRAHRLPRG